MDPDRKGKPEVESTEGSGLRISERVKQQGLGKGEPTEDPVETWCQAHALEGERVLDLICTNPTEVGLDYSCYRDVFAEAAVLPQMLQYEPNPAGLEDVRRAIAGHFREVYGEPLMSHDILLTASTSESYAVLFDMLTDPGDAVLLPQPGYPLVEVIATHTGVQMDSYALKQQAASGGNWQLDLGALEAAVHDRTRAILCISPHNPTGTVLSIEEIAFLDELCCRRGIVLIIDEVFRDYTEVSFKRLNAIYHLKCPTFILNGMSKLAALPQLKLAWITLGGAPAHRTYVRPILEYLLDAQLSVSNFAQWVTPGVLRQVGTLQQQIRERCSANFRLLEEFANPLRLILDAYLSGWYAVIRENPRWSGADVSVLLARHCALKVHPGYFYGMPDPQAIVFSLLVEPVVLQEGLARLREFLI